MTISPTDSCKILEAKLTDNFSVELKRAGKFFPFLKGSRRHLGNSEDEFWALKKVSLTIPKGEVFGIVGRNGAGKTTLLNLIAGVLSPNEGEVIVKGKVLGLFNLGTGFQDELSGRENIFLNAAILRAGRQEVKEKASAIIDFSELGEFIDMPLGSYSQGMRLRLGFSIIANLDFDILIIDEILAVGDALFQSKCFQRLMDFKRGGKTLIVTTQSVDFIERLCGRAALLDHGELLFQGSAPEAVDRYRKLLSSEEFFVGPKRGELLERTKRWAEDKEYWGKKLGSREVLIEKVRFFNKFGFSVTQAKSGEALRIRVDCSVKNLVKEPHLGIAIFRNDGVYCYGPNTAFDGYAIPDLKTGKFWFELFIDRLMLAPGEYRISVAVWDKFETLAYDYHNGFYPLSIRGDNPSNYLSGIPVKINSSAGSSYEGNISELSGGGSILLLDAGGREKDRFLTNESVTVVVDLGSDKIGRTEQLEIYRDDNVFCQGIPFLQPQLKKKHSFIFREFPLLPGGYIVKAGKCEKKFSMLFHRQDHGTVYLEHKWKWKAGN